MSGKHSRWRIGVTDAQHRDRDGTHAEVWFQSYRGGLVLSGTVVCPERRGRVPIVKAIDRNDLLLPERIARRLLRRIHHLYWPLVGHYGDVGTIDYVDLPWLHQQFGEEAPRILALLRRAIRTFDTTIDTKGSTHEQ